MSKEMTEEDLINFHFDSFPERIKYADARLRESVEVIAKIARKITGKRVKVEGYAKAKRIELVILIDLDELCRVALDYAYCGDNQMYHAVLEIESAWRDLHPIYLEYWTE